MKVLLVQDHLRSGGAARAGSRWAELLRERGHEVTQAAGDEGGSGAVLVSGKPPRGLGRLCELVFEKASSRASRLQNAFRSLLQSQPWDLVWFHNLAGGQKWGWGTEMIGAARQRAPVLWTLHDMWALGDDDRSFWQEPGVAGGGEKNEKMLPLVSGGREQGSRIERVCGEVAKFPVTLTAPSQWLADLTRETTGKECVFLPNPIDLKTFLPGDQRAARRRLGLPEEGILFLAGADSLEDRRKGFDLLSEAWSRHRSPDTTLVLFGRHGQTQSGPIHLGILQEENSLVAAYRAADLYVHPARMENAPCTIQESLACGTPVLAFSIGGVPEMIRPGITGFLASQVTGPALGEAWTAALSPGGRLGQMREACRKFAEKIWRPESLAERSEHLLQELRGDR